MSGSSGGAPETGMLAGRRIAVIGNSNTAATAGYAAMLHARYGAEVMNTSLGNVPNVVLLTFATEPEVDFAAFDVIIVETAVVEAVLLHPHARYTARHSDETIDVFMAYMRRRTNAEIVFLILPTVMDFATPEHSTIERHYLDAAARNGAHVLNLYNLFRTVTSFDPEGRGRAAIDHAGTMLELMDCPTNARDVYGLRRLLYQGGGETQRSEVVSKGFGAQGFKDTLHISRPVHSLVAELLARWMRPLPPRQPAPPAAGDVPRVIARVPPFGANIEMVSREASLLSRHLAVLTEGRNVTYCCPPGHKAVAIMTNEITTSGYLHMESAGGRIVIECPPIVMPPRFKWLARYRMLDIPPGGDITVSVSSASEPSAGNGTGRAEIAELLVIDTDWRARLAPFGAVTPTQPATVIENEDWAREIATRTARYCAEAYFDTRWDNVVIDKRIFRRLVEALCVTDAGEPRLLDRARLFAAAEEYDWAVTALDEALARSPNDPETLKLRAAVTALANVKP